MTLFTQISVQDFTRVARERDYYKDQVNEAVGVIAQLSGTSTADFEYIHPYDLYEIINAEPGPIDVETKTTKSGYQDLVIGEKKYRQSALIPAKTTRFK